MAGLVSVIIPTKQGKDTLEKTLRSVINQTYNNIEIIVVDDNGIKTENQLETEKIVKKVSEKILYMPLDKHVNGSYARNKGFSVSSGEYIAFLDDDDFLLKNKIEMQVKMLDSEDAGMCICGSYIINKDKVGYVDRPVIKNRMMIRYLTGQYLFNTSTYLIRRNVVESLKGFDERFERHQDWEFCTRLLSKYKIVSVPIPLVIKYGEGRNKVVDVKKMITQREFFLDTLSELIAKSVGEKSLQAIENYHHRQLALTCFVQREFELGMKQIKKCSGIEAANLLSCFNLGIYLKLRKALKGSKKIDSRDLEYLVD